MKPVLESFEVYFQMHELTFLKKNSNQVHNLVKKLFIDHYYLFSFASFIIFNI